jgi:excisionase family DNA binding protein
MIDMESLLTPDEAASLLKMSKVTVLRWVKSGRLPASRLGRNVLRIRRDSVERLLLESAANA